MTDGGKEEHKRKKRRKSNEQGKRELLLVKFESNGFKMIVKQSGI